MESHLTELTRNKNAISIFFEPSNRAIFLMYP